MIEYILFILGLVLLLKGADYLVDGASSLAKKLGVSTLVIGLTIVAFGTSAPELVVNVLATLRGADDIVMGNIIGSNIANILLILGTSAIIFSLRIQHSTTWKEIPLAFLAAMVLLIFANTKLLDNLEIGYLLRFEGIILIAFFIIFMAYVIQMAKSNRDDKLQVVKHDYKTIFFMVTGSLIAIYVGGKWTVDGAAYIARQLGLSEYLIASTIIAVGTSLPELMTSIVAAIRKDADLSVGNVVGSNIFNILFVLGITSIISPVKLHSFINIDLLIVIFVTLLLFIFVFVGRKHMIDRWQGTTFIALYAVYIAYIIIRG